MTKQERDAFFVSEIALEEYSSIRIMIDEEGDYSITNTATDVAIFIPLAHIKHFQIALDFMVNQ